MALVTVIMLRDFPNSFGITMPNGSSQRLEFDFAKDLYSKGFVSDPSGVLSLSAQDANGGDFSTKIPILSGGVAGNSTSWLEIAPYPERLMYILDSGTTTTTFSIDVSADGSTSLAQAYTGTYASSSLAEVTPPILYSNPQAKYFKISILSGGPITFYRGA